jgi:chemotaxis protein methyltransferase CheR
VTADDPGFAALARQISEQAGLALDAYKDKCLRRRIAVRMRACGVRTFAEYQALLARTPGEYEQLVDALTINVTRFFRNAETWERLRREHLPALWNGGHGPLRCWSAGCASGEEPYGLAILAAELAAARGRPEALEQLQVDATDIDRQSLERARLAYYGAPAFAETPPELLRRYFEAAGTEYRVVDPIRRRVTIRRHDLSRDPPPGRGYQMILCRNVVIYFERPVQERLFVRFATALAPGGLLVLGKVETVFGPARDRLTPVDVRERIYRRAA